MKSPTIYDITERMIFESRFMISPENFEIRTVLTETALLETAPVSQLSQFFSAQDSFDSFITWLDQSIFSVP